MDSDKHIPLPCYLIIVREKKEKSYQTNVFLAKSCFYNINETYSVVSCVEHLVLVEKMLTYVWYCGVWIWDTKIYILYSTIRSDVVYSDHDMPFHTMPRHQRTFSKREERRKKIAHVKIFIFGKSKSQTKYVLYFKWIS